MQLASVEAIFAALNTARVRYLLVGGLAVNAHGYERFTKDVDLLISLEPDNIRRGLEALQSIGYQPSIPITPEQFADPSLRDSWRREKGMLVLKLWSDAHRRTPIDIFVHEPFPFDEAFHNAVSVTIGPGLTVPVIGLRDLQSMKRAAGRPQDLADIAELDRVQQLKQSSDLPPSPDPKPEL